MRRRIVNALLLLPAGAALGGCIIGTIPTPDDRSPASSDFGGDPNPTSGTGSTIDIASIFYSSYAGVTALLVVGAEGAVPASVTVGVENPRTQGEARRPATANGSFSLSIDAEGGDVLTLKYWRAGVAQDEVPIGVRPSSVAAIQASVDLAAAAAPSSAGHVISVSPPDTAGIVQVDGPPETVAAGITVVVSNPAGPSTRADATLTGSFSARLPAASGDTLVVFAVEPGTSQAGGPPATIRVP
jgi:hypothetical protein